MRLSEQWLRTWINPAISREALTAELTMAGLEVDSIAPVAPTFEGVIVAEILSTSPHPTHQKLTICELQTQDKTATVVCGDPQVAAGMKVAYAPVGATLPQFGTLTAKPFGDIVSAGMLCAWEELGIEQTGTGIIQLPTDAPVGQLLWIYLALDDVSIEVDLTPNRGDCLSIQGMARELSAITEVAMLPQAAIEPVQPTLTKVTQSVVIDAPEACPHYFGRSINGVNTQAATPIWLQERLRRSGIRTHSIVVDILNYVMLELGQPLHAFDANQLSGDLSVRWAQPSESLKLLDEQTVQLTTDTLVIADEKGPVAIAGVMGGLESGVSDKTTDIFLESALFTPPHLAGCARRYGLSTDASCRYERGVDPTIQNLALERATALIVKYSGGEVAPIVTQQSGDTYQPTVVNLRASQVQRILGLHLSAQAIEKILARLGAQYTLSKPGVWQVSVPSYRYDIHQEVDLIEECARLYGYHQIPEVKPEGALIPPHADAQASMPLRRLKQCLVDRGYYEAITYSFIDPSIQRLIAPNAQVMPLKNPLSQALSEMRTSLWPGLLMAVQHNVQRQQGYGKLFESGLVFQQEADTLQQRPVIGGVIFGQHQAETWATTTRAVDFFDIKGDIEALWALNGQGDLTFEATPSTALHPGQSALIRSQGTVVGRVGAVHPVIVQQLDLPEAIYVFELDQAVLQSVHQAPYQPISKFPMIKRDLAVVIAETVAAESVVTLIKQTAGTLLRDIKLFDVYQGEGISAGHKSLAMTLILQTNSRTLIDSEVDALMASIINELQHQLAAELRD